MFFLPRVTPAYVASNCRLNHESGVREYKDLVIEVKVRTAWEGIREQGVEVNGRNWR